MTDQLQPVEPMIVTRVRRSESTAKLDEALAKAALEFGEVHKGTENPFYKSKYADLSSLISATRTPLAKHGVTLRQWPFSETGRAGIVSRLACQGEWEESEYSMPLSKQDAQGVGSALTYARRYAYQGIVNIAGELDDDGNAASGKSSKDDVKAPSKPVDAILAVSQAARKGGKSEEAVMAYLANAFEITNYKELHKQEPEVIDQIIRWCLNSEQDLTTTLKASVKAAKPAPKGGLTPQILYTAATNHAVPDEDVKIFMQEHFGAKSSKELNQAQLKETLDWIETVGA